MEVAVTVVAIAACTLTEKLVIAPLCGLVIFTVCPNAHTARSKREANFPMYRIEGFLLRQANLGDIFPSEIAAERVFIRTRILHFRRNERTTVLFPRQVGVVRVGLVRALRGSYAEPGVLPALIAHF